MIAVLFLLTFFSNVLAAENFPAREISLVTSNPPGGFVDTAIRLMKDSLAKNLGVPVVVEYRSGAGGATGTLFVAKSKPDGYTIACLASRDTTIVPATIPSIPYKYTDLDPLCKYCVAPGGIIVKGDAPWKTWNDLVADAKKRPNKITYGCSTNSISEFQIGGFIKAAGISLVHVAMASAQEVTVRILGGNLDIGAGSSPTTYAGQLKAGKLRYLFVVSKERSPSFPDLPTYREYGLPDPVIDGYCGFFVPLGLPKPIRETLQKALEKTLTDPAMKKKCDDAGFVLDYSPSEAFAKEIAEGVKEIKEVVKSAGPKT